MADDLVRVRLENGYEATVSSGLAEVADLKVLDEDAVNDAGDVLPTTRANGRPDKPRTSVAKKATEKAASDASAKDDGQK